VSRFFLPRIEQNAGFSFSISLYQKPRVIRVVPEVPVQKSVKILTKNRIGCLPVVETDNTLARIIHRYRGASPGSRYHSAFASLTNTTSIRSITKSTVILNLYAIGSLSGESSRLDSPRPREAGHRIFLQRKKARTRQERRIS